MLGGLPPPNPRYFRGFEQFRTQVLSKGRNLAFATVLLPDFSSRVLAMF